MIQKILMRYYSCLLYTSTVDAYLGRNNRNTTVQVATNGGVSKSVSVVQKGKAIYITKESDPNVVSPTFVLKVRDAVRKTDLSK